MCKLLAVAYLRESRDKSKSCNKMMIQRNPIKRYCKGKDIKIIRIYNFIAITDDITIIHNYHEEVVKLYKFADDAYDEVQKITKRNRRTTEELKINNRYRGGKLPYGLDLLPNGILKENEKEQKIIKEILKLSKKITFEAIARRLNMRDIKTKYGKKWRRSTIYKLIKKHEKIL